MSRVLTVAAGVVLVLGVLALFGAVYTVEEGQQAIVL